MQKPKCNLFLFVVGVAFGNTIFKNERHDLGGEKLFISEVILAGKICKIKTCITNLTNWKLMIFLCFF